MLKLLKQSGWTLKNQEGSHRQFVHPSRPGKVTVSGHESNEIKPKTLKTIQIQAGLEK